MATAFEDAAITRAPALIRDQVADQLRQAIVEMRLRPGQLLVERELCEATTASRATVREALRQLQSEGLVESTVGKGTVVTRLSQQEATQIYEVRASLEGLAGKLFAQYATPDQLAALNDAVTAVEDAIKDTARMLRAKTTFYDVLIEGSRNDELRRILQGLHARATLVRATSLSRPGRAQHSVDEIKAIAAAAAAGDPEETSRLCVEHIRMAAAAAFDGEPPPTV